MFRIGVDRLLALVAATFERAGCAPEEARAVANGLVDANLTGHDSHGVVRVPRYLFWLGSGVVDAGRSVSVLTDAGALTVLDGHYGFGATVGRQAVELGIERALAGGVAIVALRHAGHLGRIGQWAELAVGQGLASVHLVNVAGSMLVAPFGGVDRRFSTAPMAFGFPVPGEPPVVLDFATSAVAEGKVLVASNGGKPLPPGSLVTTEGDLSADPATLYGPLGGTTARTSANGTGAIRAMGEHKGSGLALMCELMAGALTGSGTSGPGEHRMANGMLSVYMAPAAFGSTEAIAAETRAFLDFVRSARPMEAGSPVLAPGEPERLTRADRLANGIPLTDEIWASIRTAALDHGIAEADPLLHA